jgi:hypothetical protein
MAHCGFGANTFSQFDLLGAVVNWVENGRAPDTVVAERRAPQVGSRPMCQHPAYPHYTGGDPALASSFQCRLNETAASAGPR